MKGDITSPVAPAGRPSARNHSLPKPPMIDACTPTMPLEARLRDAMAVHPYLARRNLRCETHEGRVTLYGVVNSYFHKQMAQETIRRMDGVREVENLLEVHWA